MDRYRPEAQAKQKGNKAEKTAQKLNSSWQQLQQEQEESNKPDGVQSQTGKQRPTRMVTDSKASLPHLMYHRQAANFKINWWPNIQLAHEYGLGVEVTVHFQVLRDCI
jgi:hypothetical protein